MRVGCVEFRNEMYSQHVKAFAKDSNSEFLTLCGNIEMEISNLTQNEQIDYLLMYGLKSSGLDQLIKLAYKMLGLETFFTAGEKEIKAWTIKKGFSAPQAAGTIHTDFERGFICAETISFADYKSLGGEQAAKVAGRMRQEGSEYAIQEGDVILYRFNV